MPRGSFDHESAASHGIVCCTTCSQLARVPEGAQQMACPRCGNPLHFRKPRSLQRTWSLLITAYVLLIPANVLPIMETGSLFGSQKDTIMSGIIYLCRTGSWALGLIVFIASILVPLAKLLSLTYILISVRHQQRSQRVFRTRLYRMLEFIGPWSMLDIYVVTLLSVLVQLQGLANILPMPGAIAFGAVVVTTMLATQSFDPRLIWDAGASSKSPPLPRTSSRIFHVSQT